MTEGKFYKRIFLKSGLADYKDVDDGVLLIEKPCIENAISTLINKPVIITHDGVEPVGKVVDAYYNLNEEAFVCGFIVWDKQAQDLLDNKDYTISCTYDVNEYNEGGNWHNIPYDKEAINITFENIAIVEKPRYQEAKKIINSIQEEDVENGGVGSGNWGHKGRKGKIGGSGKGGNKPERLKYGRTLRKLYDKTNFTKADKERLKERIKSIKEQKSKSKDLKTKSTNPKIGDFEIKKQTDKAYLLNKDGKDFWVQKRWVRKDGTLTPSGEKALNNVDKIKNIDETFKKKWNEGFSFGKPTKETEKAVSYEINFSDPSNEYIQSRNLWVPKSMIKDGKIPSWFLSNKIKELEDTLPSKGWFVENGPEGFEEFQEAYNYKNMTSKERNKYVY